jgi:beta-mannosidase
MDLTYAYRFGPPAHDLVVATLLAADTRARLSEAFFFPLGLPSSREDALGLEAFFEDRGGLVREVTIRTRRFAQSVIDHGFDGSPYRAAVDILLRRPIAGG